MTRQSKIKKINNILIKRDKTILWLFAFSILLFVFSHFYFAYTESTLSFEIEKLDKELASLTAEKSSIEIEYIEDIERVESIGDNFALTDYKDIEYLNSTNSSFVFNN